jgi:hypothetical protein
VALRLNAKTRAFVFNNIVGWSSIFDVFHKVEIERREVREIEAGAGEIATPWLVAYHDWP